MPRENGGYTMKNTNTQTANTEKAIVTAYGNGDDLVYAYADGTYSDGKNHAITTRSSGKKYIVVNGLTYSEREKQADGSFAPARKGASGVTHKNKTKHYADGVLETEVGCAYTLMSDIKTLFLRMVEHTANAERVSKALMRAFRTFVDKAEREALVSEYEAERAEAEAKRKAEAEARSQAEREKAVAGIVRNLLALGFTRDEAQAQAEAMASKLQATETDSEKQATTDTEC